MLKSEKVDSPTASVAIATSRFLSHLQHTGDDIKMRDTPNPSPSPVVTREGSKCEANIEWVDELFRGDFLIQFPDMTFGVGEVSGATTPRLVFRWLDEG